MKLYYLAYGSNLHPERLRERVPSAVFYGATQLPEHRLHFHKRQGDDGSGKCNAYYTGSPDDSVHAVVYEIESSEKHILDSFEGRGYEVQSKTVVVGFFEVMTFTYIATEDYIDDALTPHDWYRDIVLEGARFHAFPDDYIARIEQISVHPDPDMARHARAMDTLELMRNIKPGAF